MDCLDLENILSSIPNNIYWVDKNNIFLGCNTAHALCFGFKTQKEIIGKSYYDLVPKKYADVAIKCNKEIMQTGQAKVFEELALLPDGTEAIFLSYKSPLRNKRKEIIGVIGNSINITPKNSSTYIQAHYFLKSFPKITGCPAEYHTIEEYIKSIQEYYEAIIAQMPGHVYWEDAKGIILGCNDSQAQDSGLIRRENAVGKTIFDFLSKDQALVHKKNNESVLRTGEKLTFEEITTLANGKQVIYLSQKSPIKDRYGHILGILGISIDITERKKAEEELKQALLKAEVANQAKTEFLENMRHDIRTPLSGIVGFADLLKETKDLGKTHEYADNLIASSHALLDFLNEVLEAIKVASGEIPLLKKKFDLKAKLSEVLKLNQAKAAQKNLKFFLDYYDKVPQYVVGDPIRLQRIFLELVNNALNFTHKGQVKTSVHLAKENGQDMVIKLIVEDTGIGIPEDKQQEVFTRFKRLTPSFQGIYKGAGLGLSIVKQFIDDLHGEIYVESKPGKGSTFTCIIPLQKALIQDNSGIHQEPATAIVQLAAKILPIKKLIPAKLKTNGKSNILLVEDDDFAADITKTILESLGCNVKIAVNGEEAVKLTCSNHYDMLFMDIGLPDMDGYETTKRIRQCEVSKESSTPIIALSAHSGVDSAKKCIEAGMSAVLTKPLMHDKALDILNAFIPSRAKIKKSAEEKTKKSAKTAEQVVNLTAMKKDFDNKIIQSILELALKELPDRKKQFIAVYNKKDWELLRSLAHKMRGTAAYCRAERMHKACGELDDYLLTKKEPKTIAKLYNQALQEIETFGKYLKNFNKVKILSA